MCKLHKIWNQPRMSKPGTAPPPPQTHTLLLAGTCKLVFQGKNRKNQGRTRRAGGALRPRKTPDYSQILIMIEPA